MLFDHTDLIDAGAVVPGDQKYTVVYCDGHKTLQQCDVVIMRECGGSNYLVRESDLTVHGISSPDDQYVILSPLRGCERSRL